MGVHNTSGARVAAIIPTWPRGGRRSVAFAESCRERFGRNRRNNPVVTGDYDKGWSAQSLGTHELARDPPQTSARFVIPVPRTRAAIGHPDRQRHSIIDPVLKSHKAASFAAIGVEIRKTNEFAHGEKGSRT